MRDLNHFHLKLTALSPVHIGTGESYEPTNFVIDDGKLYEFDEILFYKSLSDIDKLALKNKMSNWLQIIEFYKTKKDKAKKISFFECRVSNKVQSKYEAKNPNQLHINRTFKNPNTHRAIIPGSSIKGMLDTVLGIYTPKASNEERQKLIVSDALLVDGGVEIGFSYRVHRVKKAESKIPQMVEVIEPKSSFVLGIKTKYSFSQLQDFIKNYHLDRKNSIYQEDKNSFIARIGKYSGMEYMVYNGKNLKNSYGKPLATYSIYESDKLKDKMFGWIKLELMSKEDYQDSLEEIKKQEQEYYQNRDKKQEEILKAIKEIELKAKYKAEKKAQIEAEEKRRVEEEKAKREAELAAMSPVELFLESLKSKNMPLETALLNAIKNDEVSDDIRCDCILYLKKYLIKNKKWKETTKAKKPEKDKSYQMTLKLMEFLKECN